MSENKKFDVIIIGAGPGGYVCAIRCAQLGLKTACVEKRESLGGTCLNVGCIPSKALLQASEKFAEAENHLEDMGIKTSPKLDLKKMMGFKDKVVEANTKGVEFLFKKNKVERITGTAKITGPGIVEVNGESYSADNIVIATGSDVISLPGIEIDEENILSSTGALDFSEVPKTMAVIGGGYIGLEMGCVWSRLGAEVTVIEYLDRVLPGMDGEVSKEMFKILKKQGLDFRLSSRVTGAKSGKKGVEITIEPADGGDEETVTVDKLLVAVGRKPYTDGLGLENVGVETDDRGRIKTDDTFETSAEGIFAIGDVRPGPMLAHKAEDEGIVLAEMLAGQSGHIDYDRIPGVVYTWPEAAQVGKTEEQLKEAGTDYKSGKFLFMANGRARAMNAAQGFVKILADAKTDRVLGAHMIGPNVGELIAEIVAVMEFEGTAEDILRASHAHPTLSEAVRESALAVHGRAIHS